MTPNQLKRARQKLGRVFSTTHADDIAPEHVRKAFDLLELDHLSEFAGLLGYEGVNTRQMGYDLTKGKRPIREPQRRLIVAYLSGYRPPDWPV